ncbi:2-hydroxyacid dehydrogenase [Psychroflexus aestuariivivens]|uniref:2-hydroxyacid dehydrogenase n=1 Tax=Psychroflexus aestuariivivens TaxID=1795040 RepID=UPI000FDA5427|nr:2-hydroxyacid dehydrogenase [Psychroflexus aestuariivivens]
MKILHIDSNHPLMLETLSEQGFENVENYSDSKSVIAEEIHNYDGIIIRSRFQLDREFLEKAKKLKFIGRVGAGLENIDVEYAQQQSIKLYNAPEGNRNAVGEHALGMLLNLMNNMQKAHQEVCNGLWKREENRGFELEGKTVGIIGYGNMGKAFAKKLQGFDCRVLCYDLKQNIGDEFAEQVDLKTLQNEIDVLSLHTPLTSETKNMVNANFISEFKKPFWFINTARGQSVVTEDLVEALQANKICGAALDVLEFEKTSFENLFSEGEQMPEAMEFLTKSNKVLLSPHIAGWTFESEVKLAQTITDKILKDFAL